MRWGCCDPRRERRSGGWAGRRRLGIVPLLAAAALAASPAALPAAADAAGPSYVAMGDSYTAAPGVTPQSSTAPPECGRSQANYPHLVAAALGLSLTDVSCSGAATENFTVAQFSDQPPQFDALTSSTALVTVSMGGNDNDLFETLVTGCTELDFEMPNVGAPCEREYEAFVDETFAGDLAAQERALAEIHTLSPKAKVFIVGYPEIAPIDGYCPTAIPWTTGDLRWFHQRVEERENTIMRREAKRDGAIFVGTLGPSKAHNACEPVGVRWIEPLLGSLTGVGVHPNAVGEEHDALDVERSMRNHGIR
jgi:hypothetical protein